MTIIKISSFGSIMNLTSFPKFSYLKGTIKIILWIIHYLVFATMNANEIQEATFIFSKINNSLNHLLNKVQPSYTKISNLY